MKKYWKKIVIFIIVLLIVLLTVLFIGKNYFHGDDIPYKDISYYIPIDSYCSCLNLSGDNKFFEYDCDSEPSNMPFSGEVYDKYYYNKKKNIIIFKGFGKKSIKATVLKWTEDELKIKVINSSYQSNRCSSNRKNIYTYYKSEDLINGKKLKTFINSNNGDLHFGFWYEDGRKYYNFYDKENDICANCITSTTNDILYKISDDVIYNVKYNRDKNGKITYLDIVDNDY